MKCLELLQLIQNYNLPGMVILLLFSLSLAFVVEEKSKMVALGTKKKKRKEVFCPNSNLKDLNYFK